MNMNDKPFADWSWKNQQQAAPMQNIVAPLGSGSMEQAPATIQEAPDPTMQALEGYGTSKGMEELGNVANQAYQGYKSAAPLGNILAPVSDALVQPVVNGVAQSAPAISSAIPAATTALEGATALAPLAEGAALAGTAGTAAGAAGAGAAGTAAASGLAGAGAGATAALAAMGPLGWAGLGLLGAKALGGK
jgi:hypothetical protein